MDDVLTKRMVMAETDRTAVVLWIAHTYVYERFAHTPRLLITSAGPAMGKSELMKLVAHCSNGGQKIDGATPASLFRIKDYRNSQVLLPEEGPAPMTLCLDQLDPVGQGSGDAKVEDDKLMNLLCSSTEVGASKLMSVRGEPGSGKMWVPAKFEYGIPTALGKIGLIPSEALMTRAIIVRMLPETPRERADQMAERKLPLPHVRSLLHSALCTVPAVYTKAPAGTPSRMEDIWQPLLAIARVAGPGWKTRAEATMVEMAAALETPEPRAFKLVRQAAEAVAKLEQLNISRADLWKRLGGWEKLHMDEQKMRELLQAGGLKIKTVKIHHKPMRGYAIRDIRNAAARLRKVAAGDGAVMPETPVVTAVTPVSSVSVSKPQIHPQIQWEKREREEERV